MQQTETYKLNLIEKTDTFSPDALNENTQKVEAALTQKADAADTNSLEGRVTALEARRVVLGHYKGNAANNRVIDLGFTPVAVLLLFQSASAFIMLMTEDYSMWGAPNDPGRGTEDMQGIVAGGFFVSSSGRWNASNVEYLFLALS